MKFWKALVSLTVLVLATGVVWAKRAEKRCFLVDQRTQMPVLSYPLPPNWLAGGKTTWTGEAAAPVIWYVWMMSPDQQVKMIFSSIAALPARGQIQQVDFLQDPTLLANRYLPDVQRDHHLTRLRLVEAHFQPREPEQSLIESRLRMAREHGIQPTNFMYTELVIRYEGRRGGRKWAAVLLLPMLAMENRPGMDYATLVELLSPMSFSCPPKLVKDTQKRLVKIVKAVQMNPHFVAAINRISVQRMANWIRVQNEIRDEQLELAASISSTQDRVRDQWSEYIRDVDTVSNPNTGEQMFLDNRYDCAWINSENEIIYHNSDFNSPDASTASFDPNSDVLFNQTTWQRLK